VSFRCSPFWEYFFQSWVILILGGDWDWYNLERFVYSDNQEKFVYSCFLERSLYTRVFWREVCILVFSGERIIVFLGDEKILYGKHSSSNCHLCDFLLRQIIKEINVGDRFWDQDLELLWSQLTTEPLLSVLVMLTIYLSFIRILVLQT